jgi:hypothetical protein
MITQAQQRQVLERAYVPEHIVSLMALLSGGEPFLVEDFLCLARDDWLILVGYPLERPFSTESLARVHERAVKRFRPAFSWLIAPEIPPSLSEKCVQRERDAYYVLDLDESATSPRLLGIAKRASAQLCVGRSQRMSGEHAELIEAFLARETPAPRVGQLFLSMPQYVGESPSTVVLEARDRQGGLSAFYVVELAASSFAVYLVGCRSKKNAVAYASDLLFLEMIKLAREHGKRSINLGLGVNEGIRRFKEKWGGRPSLKYEFCEHVSKTRRALGLLGSLGPRY